ncbi:MAG: type III-A CRISPR-associated RAMP protein Csm4 [Bacteroidetes bacterium]|nr:type III-A CRISPR-associated RAMP protein Csm4 [Bacteroidota bacterium]
MLPILLRVPSGSRFHLGKTDVDDTSLYIHSDTLFSAWVNMFQWMYGSGQEMIGTARAGRFRLSSAFPCIEIPELNRVVRFLPRPDIAYRQEGSDEVKNRKVLKKIQWVSEGVYARISAGLSVNGNHIGTSYSLQKSNKDLIRLGKSFLALTTEIPVGEPGFSFLETLELPKVTVHTDDKTGSLYQEASFRLTEPVRVQTGTTEMTLVPAFYFLLDHQLETPELNRYLAALRMLGDEGIGGNRSTGCGKFSPVVPNDFQQKPDRTSPLVFCLSVLSPKDEGDFGRLLRYDLFIRGGGSLGRFGNQDLHRKQARFCKEGAIGRPGIDGRLVDLSPAQSGNDHPVFRNGIAFTIPFGVSES